MGALFFIFQKSVQAYFLHFACRKFYYHIDPNPYKVELK